MKKAVILISSLLVSLSAFAGESLNCEVKQTDKDPNHFDKLVYSGVVEKNDVIYIKTNGESGKMNISTSTADQLLALENSIAVAGGIEGQLISLSIGTFSIREKKDGKYSDAWTISDKSNPIILISTTQNVAVHCEVK